MPENFNQNISRKIKDIILENKNFLIISHDFPDGDCLGSMVSLYELLVNLKKNAAMLCNGEIPYQYFFLPHCGLIKENLNDINVGCVDRDCICFCLDSADEKRFSFDIYDIRKKVKLLVNIDHHPGNTMYGEINMVDPLKSATAEILYDFLSLNFAQDINYNIALGIYTGILTDTGRFQYSSTSFRVHKIISELLKLGVVPAQVFSCIYENEPFQRFKLLELVLKRIKLARKQKIIYSYLLLEDFKNLKLPYSANDGVIELLRSSSEAKIAALFKQVSHNLFKVSLRSSEECYAVDEIAAKFGGGGHKMASAYSQQGILEDIISSLINVLKKDE